MATKRISLEAPAPAKEARPWSMRDRDDGAVVAPALRVARARDAGAKAKAAFRIIPERRKAQRAPRANQELLEPLTQRELEVLGMICEGDSNHDIARRLAVKMATVKWHVHHIFGKLGVQRRTQAVVVAIYFRLVAPAWLEVDGRRDPPDLDEPVSPPTA